MHVSGQGLGYVVAQQHQTDLHLLPGLQAVAFQILILGFERLLDTPDKLTDIVIAQPRGRLIIYWAHPPENRVRRPNSLAKRPTLLLAIKEKKIHHE